MTEKDKLELMRRFEPFGREIPKDQVMSVIARVPTTDRPKGEWIESREQNILMAKRIEKGETWRVCSNCGTGFMIGAQYEGQKLYGKRFHNFCPRCGADMRGEDE